MKDTLYHALVAAGIETDNHESDLYFPLTVESQAILQRFPVQNGVATYFKHAGTGKVWYDVPFAYTPWWDAREARHAS